MQSDPPLKSNPRNFQAYNGLKIKLASSACSFFWKIHFAQLNPIFADVKWNLSWCKFCWKINYLESVKSYQIFFGSTLFTDRPFKLLDTRAHQGTLWVPGSFNLQELTLSLITTLTPRHLKRIHVFLVETSASIVSHSCLIKPFLKGRGSRWFSRGWVSRYVDSVWGEQSPWFHVNFCQRLCMLSSKNEVYHLKCFHFSF